jgi:hypothetical protein
LNTYVTPDITQSSIVSAIRNPAFSVGTFFDRLASFCHAHVACLLEIVVVESGLLLLIYNEIDR